MGEKRGCLYPPTRPTPGTLGTRQWTRFPWAWASARTLVGRGFTPPVTGPVRVLSLRTLWVVQTGSLTPFGVLRLPTWVAPRRPNVVP